MADSFYVTTPIYYVNDRPHIGHVYTTTIADIVARWHRLLGERVFFLTGTDEHAAKVADAARAHNVAPQAWADLNAMEFQRTFTRLGLGYDDFIRTTERRHVERVERYVAEMIAGGDVYLGEYEGWYDAGQEEYVPETKAKEHGYNSPINGKPLVKKRENNYFFRLSAFADELLRVLEDGTVRVLPDARRNEVVARIREGLNDVPMSRTGASGWGIPVPGDPEHTIYVWIDALFNYLTGTDTDERRALWPADVHYVGKDILWFHTVIWFSMLLALRRRPGYEWVDLPRAVYAHSFWMGEGRKMSKSLGNFIDIERIDAYVRDFGLDALRWFLATQGPLGTTDSDFSHERFCEIYNTDLANTLGNCVSRVANMIGRYCGGRLPARGAGDDGWPERAAGAVRVAREAMADLAVDRAARAALDLVREVDGYIDRTQPFKLAKDPERHDQVGPILRTCAEALRVATVLLWPVLPTRVEEAWRRMGCGGYAEALAASGRGDLEAWTAWGGLEDGATLETGQALFPRYEPPGAEGAAPAAAGAKTKQAKQTKHPRQATTKTQGGTPPVTEETQAPEAGGAAAAPAQKPEVTYDQFAALDIRVAKVLSAEPVPKTDKLYKVELELEEGRKRTVLAGIRPYYEPDQLLGRQVVYLQNLAPRKIRGVVSEGMILAAGGPDGGAILLRPEREAPLGTTIS